MPTRYRPANIVFHWLMAVLLTAQVWLGWWMIDLPKTPPGLRAGWFNTHKSIGLMLLVLLIVRALLRRRFPAPPFPVSMSSWERAVAHASHLSMYVVLIALPLGGLIGSLASGYPIKFFGLPVPLPTANLPTLKQFMSVAHLTLVWVFMGLTLAHVAAALRHLMLRDGIFERMLPRRN